MIQVPDIQFDRLLLMILDWHADAYPDVEPKLAKARATLKRHLRKTVSDSLADVSRNHQAYRCSSCNSRFWVEKHDGDAVCPKCGNLCGME